MIKDAEAEGSRRVVVLIEKYRADYRFKCGGKI